MGLATCMLILLYVFDEMSYDRHHRDVDRIFRVATRVPEATWAATGAPFAQGLKSDFPEVAEACRLLKFPNLEKMLLKYEQNQEKKQFFESNGYYVDSTFFRIFTYDFLYGDAQTALSQPNTLVLSSTLAGKMYGDENPLDRVITIGLPFGDFNYTIKGVFEDTETKSHIDAHFFLSMKNGDVGEWVNEQNNWATNNIFHTYIKLREGTDIQALEKKLPDFMDRRASADLKAMGIPKSLFTQPLADIYLKSDLGNEISPNGNLAYLYIFGSIAAFLLLIACINFMNLSTARSEKRAREVGVRKVMGALQSSLIRQFLGESMMMSGMALLLAAALIQLILPGFNTLTQKNLVIAQHPEMVGWIAGLALFTGLLSGLYPAFYLSSFKPITVLKGKLINHFSAAAIRKGLVVFQFTISVALIFGALVIWRQLDFVQNQPLGFNKNQQIVIPLQSNKAAENYLPLKNEMTQHPEVVSVTSGSTYPGIPSVEDLLFYAEGKSVNEAVDIHHATVENNFIETLGFELLYGRAFSDQFKSDSSGIILNEVAVRQLGYEAKTAVGKKIYYEWRNVRYTMEIVGIVKDFNFQSLHNSITPFAFVTSLGNKHSYFIANVRSDNYSGILADIETAWKKINPDTPFAYSFLDKDFQKNYEKEQRTARIIVYFMFIAVLIACLGLFGLASFTAERRTREIGIRKVLGASVGSITGLLSSDFLKLVVVAIVIASPLAYYAMNKWLAGFAYRIDMQWWMFVGAGLAAILIAFFTVGFQSIKAALANPVKSLKNE